MPTTKSKSPLLSATKTEVLTKQKVEIPESLFNDVIRYAEWVGIESFDDVVRQSLEYVLSSDKAWQQQEKADTRSVKIPASKEPAVENA